MQFTLKIKCLSVGLFLLCSFTFFLNFQKGKEDKKGKWKVNNSVSSLRKVCVGSCILSWKISWEWLSGMCKNVLQNQNNSRSAIEILKYISFAGKWYFVYGWLLILMAACTGRDLHRTGSLSFMANERSLMKSTAALAISVSSGKIEMLPELSSPVRNLHLPTCMTLMENSGP